MIAAERSTADEQAPVFAALGDPTRLRLMQRLGAANGLSITALTENSGITRQAVTKHLHVLARAGLVQDHAHGRERVYRVDPAPLGALASWIAQYQAVWAANLDRLDDYLQTLQAKDPTDE